MKKLLEKIKEYNKEPVHYEAPYLDTEDMQKIEKAVEKQISIKCVKDDCERDCCPVCGWIIGYGDTVQPYCHNCGQKLDWCE